MVIPPLPRTPARSHLPPHGVLHRWQEHAVKLANRMRLPLVACYGLWERFPEANERCFAFLLDGLRDLKEALQARGVQLVVLPEPPPQAVMRMCSGAAGLVCDAG